MKIITVKHCLAMTLLLLFSSQSFAQVRNLALQQWASSNSEMQAAGEAVDGNNGTRWESFHGVDPVWLSVDLGMQFNVQQVIIRWETANAANYSVQGSNDNANWVTLAQVTGGQSGERTDTHNMNGDYRYIRMYGTQRSTQWGYSIWEMQVMGDDVPVPTPTPTPTPAGDPDFISDLATATASTAIQAASLAVDGDLGTRWESAHQVDPSWLTLDFGAQYVLSEIEVIWEAANAGVYEVQVSTNGANWTNVRTITGGAFGERTDVVDMNNVAARYLRIYGTQRSAGNNWGYSIWELNVFTSGGQPPLETPTPTPTPTVTPTPTPESGQTEVVIDMQRNILVAGPDADQPNFTLYVFDNDLGNASSTCYDGCAVNWPPVLVTDGTASGTANLGTVVRNDGTAQATYEGRPLYYYIGDNAVGDTFGDNVGGVWHMVSFGGFSDVVPLYNPSTPLEPEIVEERNDVLITRIADRARDRHAKENHFSNYDHYLTFYWEQRTAGIEILDYVAKGGDRVVVNVRPEHFLDAKEARTFYIGTNTLAEFCGNGGLVQQGPGSLNYQKVMTMNCREGNRPIQIGDKIEMEISQFLEPAGLMNGRTNYYGTTYLYIVGEGLVPWDTYQTGVHQPGVPFINGVRQRDSKKIPESAWLGGHTTIHAEESHEPDNHFLQMATNTGYSNGQPFVLGRRLAHTSFVDGGHDESAENGVFNEMVGLSNVRYINGRCVDCHIHNGGAKLAGVGESLDKWVVKLADQNGAPSADYGRVLQPNSQSGAGEPDITLASWTEANGLRSPNFQFAGSAPAQFSARIAPRLVGMGLIDAISEVAILAKEDPFDENGDGISGRASLVADPVTGETRLGRFGWKASQASLRQQVASALNTDMGVMTSIFPNPDCGVNQGNCGPSGVELNDTHLDNLEKYVALLGVRPQRDYDNGDVIAGENIFKQIGCESCHTQTLQTSPYHPLAELRNQTVHPYSDFLLHDMGYGLADNFNDGNATGTEWRTTPLWGIGLAACVSGGVTGDKGGVPFGADTLEYCTPNHSYLHDGRARSIEEAILWHGGEAAASRDSFNALNGTQRNQVLRFVESL